MAVKDVTPFVSKNTIVQFGAAGDDFAKAVSSAILTPSGGIVTYKGLKKGAVYSFPEDATFTFDLTYAQDWGTVGSLSMYLFEHQGENVEVTFDANDVATGGKTTWSFTVAITAGAVGGAVDSVATATVSLGVVGIPVPTFPVGP